YYDREHGQEARQVLLLLLNESGRGLDRSHAEEQAGRAAAPGQDRWPWRPSPGVQPRLPPGVDLEPSPSTQWVGRSAAGCHGGPAGHASRSGGPLLPRERERSGLAIRYRASLERPPSDRGSTTSL